MFCSRVPTARKKYHARVNNATAEHLKRNALLMADSAEVYAVTFEAASAGAVAEEGRPKLSRMR